MGGPENQQEIRLLRSTVIFLLDFLGIKQLRSSFESSFLLHGTFCDKKQMPAEKFGALAGVLYNYENWIHLLGHDWKGLIFNF